MIRKYTFIILCLILLTILYINIGSITLNPIETITCLFNGKKCILNNIIFEIRLPRVLGCFIIGISLSISGLVLQTIFRNPLVEPYVLGIASGSMFFTGLVIILGISIFNIIPTLPLHLTGSIIGSLITLFIISILSSRLSIIQLLIIGLVISFLYTAGIEILVSIAELEKITYLHLALLGTLSGITWSKIYITLPILSICILLLLVNLKWLNCLLMGIDYAYTMGVNIKYIQLLSILITGILTSISVFLAGIVGFIGLAAPHIARLLCKSSRIEVVLPNTILIGSILTIVSDLLARTILLPRELPITAITSLFGAPFLAYLILRFRREYVI